MPYKDPTSAVARASRKRIEARFKLTHPYSASTRQSYYQRHKEEAKAAAQAWRKANPERVKQKKAAWWRNLTPARQADFRRKAVISAVYAHKKRRAEIHAFKEVPCLDCGIQYPTYVMDYDHRGDKKFGIAKAAACKNMSELLVEIAKCDVVCANCHRERSHQRRLKNKSNPKAT
jgi:hypothetical protein